MRLAEFISACNRKFKVAEGTYGIEIETETKSGSDYPPFFWDDTFEENGHIRFKLPIKDWIGHEDNSLRNFGREFVLKRPLNFEDALLAVDRFGEGTKDVSFIKNAPATSVHIHVNMANEEPIVVANFLTLYSLFENVLVDYSGKMRRSNLFALPMRVAEGTEGNIIKLIDGMVTGDYSKIVFNVHHVKYAALNLEPLTRFGSMEIRCFRGETDPNEIKNWLKIINQLLEFARIPRLTPRTIASEFRQKEYEFFDIVFDSMAPVVRERVEDIEKLIDRNVWYMTRIAFSVKDWSSLGEKMAAYVEEAKKKPEKKKVSMTDMKAYLHLKGYSNFHINQMTTTDIAQLYEAHTATDTASNIQPLPGGPTPGWTTMVVDDVQPMTHDEFTSFLEAEVSIDD